MDDNYYFIRKRARELVAKSPSPNFYMKESEAKKRSHDIYLKNPVVRALYGFVEQQIENDFGHGLDHAEKVAIDAGALVIIECTHAGYSDEMIYRSVLLVQCAGLLHDVKRKHKNHALKSAEFASEILPDYPLTENEIHDICQAIRNHEAFKDISGEFSELGLIISNCLYDADKFRWGPDNFTHTVWDMLSFSQIPLPVFVAHFPRGMKAVAKISDTFRSKTGKKYGPQFIDIGISIGDRLYQIIKTEF